MPSFPHTLVHALGVEPQSAAVVQDPMQLVHTPATMGATAFAFRTSVKPLTPVTDHVPLHILMTMTSVGRFTPRHAYMARRR